MNERRFENRFLCADLVRVDWMEPAGDVECTTVEGVLEDISALGACVQVEDRIPLGVSILISANFGATSGRDARPVASCTTGASFSGHVSYCEYRDYGYFIGIQFSEETRWSSGIFRPQHLTNLAVLSQTGNDPQTTRGSREGS
jgi:hypothetical protein